MPKITFIAIIMEQIALLFQHRFNEPRVTYFKDLRGNFNTLGCIGEQYRFSKRCYGGMCKVFILEAFVDTPVKFFSAGVFIADEGWKHPERKISSHELLIVHKGTVYMEVEGIQYELRKGDTMLIRPSSWHGGYAVSEKGTSFYWVHFILENSCRIIRQEQIDVEIKALMKENAMRKCKNVVLLPSYLKNCDLDRLVILCNQLIHIDQSDYLTKSATDYLVTSLLIEVTQQYIQFHASENADSVFLRILEWIRIHIRQQISLQDVANEFSYSKEYLSRYFRKKMGICMQQYINSMKISHAKELLSNTNMHVKEISAELGFHDEKYFMRLFKKIERITAGEFRNAYNKTLLNNE